MKRNGVFSTLLGKQYSTEVYRDLTQSTNCVVEDYRVNERTKRPRPGTNKNPSTSPLVRRRRFVNADIVAMNAPYFTLHP